MDQSKIEWERKNKRKYLSFNQLIWHYRIAMFPALFYYLIIKSLIEIYVTNTYDGVRSAEEILACLIPFAILTTPFVYYPYKILKYLEIGVRCTEEKFQEAIKDVTKKLNWETNMNEKDIYIAVQKGTGLFGASKKITILKDKERLLFNSMYDFENENYYGNPFTDQNNWETFKETIIKFCDSK